MTKRAVAFAVTALASFALGVMICLLGLWHFDAGSEVAKGLTKEGLLALRPGMSTMQILSILGEPLFERRNYSGELSAKEIAETWVYRRPGVFGLGTHVYLSVINGQLTGAYVEDSDLLVFRCDAQKCPDTPWRPEILDRLPTTAKKGA